MRWLLVAALGAGCATIYIPNTPEGQACNRECMFLANQCVASGINGFACLAQKRDCWRTCPGAYEGEPPRRHHRRKPKMVCDDNDVCELQ